MWNPALYSVVTEARDVHDHFPYGYDHTYGTSSGLFLAVNGAGTRNTVVWEQHVSAIMQDTEYVCYAWVRTLVATTIGGQSRLQFNINRRCFTAPFPATERWKHFIRY